MVSLLLFAMVCSFLLPTAMTIFEKLDHQKETSRVYQEIYEHSNYYATKVFRLTLRMNVSKVSIIKEVSKFVQQINWKKNVSFRSGSPAFTLLETILSITIILSISSLIPLFFQCYNKTIQLSNIDQTTEWQLFLIQTRLELEKATNIQIDGNKLSFSNGKDLITYSKYNDLVRRQVNGKGHEPLLTNVKDYQLIKKEKQLHLTVQDSNTQIYTSVFALPEVVSNP